MKERTKHIDAFNYFFIIMEKGYTTSDAVKLTAEHMGVTERTMWKWYEDLDWKIKTEKKQEKVVEEMEKQSAKTLAENRLNYLKILHKLLDNLITNDFPVEINNIRDLDTVIKACLVLQNAPTEVSYTSNVNTNIDTSNLFDESIMKNILEREEEL